MAHARGSDAAHVAGRRLRGSGVLTRLAASRGFQAWAARIPGLRRVARAEGAAIFDLAAGFVHSQVVAALVEFRILEILSDGPAPVGAMARRASVPEPRIAVLLQAGAALGLLKRRRDGAFAISRRGAAILGVPGLTDMIRHHHVLYRDLADPAAFFRGATDPALARFWPYVFGAARAEDPATAAAYSSLMADSQTLVAEEALALTDLSGARHLMDVGGGTGAFLAAAGARHSGLRLTLFDLPAVVAGAGPRLAPFGARAAIREGSFRDDPLPPGADVISLVRVLYDHADETVARLLSSVFEALAPGGRILIAEPMSGGARPDRITDTYFAVYTMAMQTGRTRSAAEIAALLTAAGFASVKPKQGYRPFVASVVTASKPG